MKYVALLRGINVGGNSIVKMSELKECFESIRLKNVQSYINSGNVLFESPAAPAKLIQQIETTLSKRFKMPLKIALLSERQLKEVIENAPKGFGTKPDKFRYDVLFLRPSVKASLAMKEVPTKDGVDQLHAGKIVLYFSRLISKASQSKLNRIVGTPIYKEVTIRNWNTTTKLLSLMK